MITCNLESAKVLVLSHFLSAFLLALIACLISLFNQGTRCLLMNVFFFKGGGGGGVVKEGKRGSYQTTSTRILRNLAEKDFACI